MAFLLDWFLLPIAFVLFLLYNYFRDKSVTSKLPPGPAGLPVVGVLPFIGQRPERTFYQWSKKYGSMMSVKIGLRWYVVLNDYDSIHQTLLKKSSEFNGRPIVSLFDRITRGHGLILIDNTSLWKVQRKFGLTALREFGGTSGFMEHCITEELSYLIDAIRAHDGNPFDLQSDLNNALANTLCQIVVGRRFDYSDPKFKEIVSQIRRAFSDPKMNRLFSLLTFAPALVSLPPFSNDARTLVLNLNAAFELFQEILSEHHSSHDQNSARDFIDRFLIEKKKNTDKSFTDFQLIQFVRDLFVAGTETMTSTLCWAILCLIHYPSTQTRIRQEIEDVIGESLPIKMSHKEKLSYASAFIQELYRFRTVVPLSVFHKTTTNVEIDNYVIPKGTTVIPNLWAVHNDEKRWPEPNKFKPERHLDEKGNFVKSPYIIPYSIGGRHCIGEQMARMETFMFLVTIVRKFELSLDPNGKNNWDMDRGTNGLTFVPAPYSMVAREI